MAKDTNSKDLGDVGQQKKNYDDVMTCPTPDSFIDVREHPVRTMPQPSAGWGKVSKE